MASINQLNNQRGIQIIVFFSNQLSPPPTATLPKLECRTDSKEFTSKQADTELIKILTIRNIGTKFFKSGTPFGQGESPEGWPSATEVDKNPQLSWTSFKGPSYCKLSTKIILIKSFHAHFGYNSDTHHMGNDLETNKVVNIQRKRVEAVATQTDASLEDKREENKSKSKKASDTTDIDDDGNATEEETYDECLEKDFAPFVENVFRSVGFKGETSYLAGKAYSTIWKAAGLSYKTLESFTTNVIKSAKLNKITARQVYQQKQRLYDMLKEEKKKIEEEIGENWEVSCTSAVQMIFSYFENKLEFSNSVKALPTPEWSYGMRRSNPAMILASQYLEADLHRRKKDEILEWLHECIERVNTLKVEDIDDQILRPIVKYGFMNLDEDEILVNEDEMDIEVWIENAKVYVLTLDNLIGEIGHMAGFQSKLFPTMSATIPSFLKTISDGLTNIEERNVTQRSTSSAETKEYIRILQSRICMFMMDPMET